LNKKKKREREREEGSHENLLYGCIENESRKMREKKNNE